MTTRHRLVSTNATTMRERGLGSSAIKDVLGRADVTAGSMYHFFPDGKEQLAAETIVRAGAIGHQTLVDSLESSESVAEGVAGFFELLSSDLEANNYLLGCPIGIPTGEAAGTIEAVREAGRAVFSSWADTIAAALVGEGWQPAPAASAARVCVALYEGASLVARADRDSSVIRDSMTAVSELLSRPGFTGQL